MQEEDEINKEYSVMLCQMQSNQNRGCTWAQQIFFFSLQNWQCKRVKRGERESIFVIFCFELEENYVMKNHFSHRFWVCVFQCVYVLTTVTFSKHLSFRVHVSRMCFFVRTFVRLLIRFSSFHFACEVLLLWVLLITNTACVCMCVCFYIDISCSI